MLQLLVNGLSQQVIEFQIKYYKEKQINFNSTPELTHDNTWALCSPLFYQILEHSLQPHCYNRDSLFTKCFIKISSKLHL